MRKFLLMILAAVMVLTAACSSFENGSEEKSIPATDLPKPPESDISVDESTSADSASLGLSEEDSEEKNNDLIVVYPITKPFNRFRVTVRVILSRRLLCPP